jgi:hypothetical protein
VPAGLGGVRPGLRALRGAWPIFRESHRHRLACPGGGDGAIGTMARPVSVGAVGEGDGVVAVAAESVAGWKSWLNKELKKGTLCHCRGEGVAGG